MLIPNGSLLYSTTDKKLYTVTNITYVDINDNIVTRPVEDWIPGAPLGNYTFNLVLKTYAFNFIPLQNPSAYEDVTEFATKNTLDIITGKLIKAFPMLTWVSTGNPENPKNYKDYVLIYANLAGATSDYITVGDIAVFEAQHGTVALIAHIRAGLIAQGLL